MRASYPMCRTSGGSVRISLRALLSRSTRTYPPPPWPTTGQRPPARTREPLSGCSADQTFGAENVMLFDMLNAGPLVTSSTYASAAAESAVSGYAP